MIKEFNKKTIVEVRDIFEKYMKQLEFEKLKKELGEE